MPIYETDKKTVIKVLKDLLCKGPYTKIYLSFGSKYNETQIIYDSFTRKTNAPFQMLPAFLRDYSENILSICIDDFSHIENKETNRKIIESVIKDSCDFVFVDWKLNILDVYISLQRILDIMKEHNIQSHEFYCAFYFKYIQPNEIEETFSEKTSELAKTIFKESIYRNSLFIWFGYQPNLYNFIYPAYYSFANYTYHLTVIQKRFNYEPINRYDIDDWISTLESNTQIRIQSFLKNCFDITQYSNDGNLWPIYDLLA